MGQAFELAANLLTGDGADADFYRADLEVRFFLLGESDVARQLDRPIVDDRQPCGDIYGQRAGGLGVVFDPDRSS